MRPIHDADVITLIAITVSSKRRPAILVEIVAAYELIQGSIPYVEKLAEAIQRLSACGLIGATDDGLTLTAVAQNIMARQLKNLTPDELINAVKSNLAAYIPRVECCPILLRQEQVSAAIEEHRASRKSPGKNLLMPKHKLDRHFKVDGRWRRASATR